MVPVFKKNLNESYPAVLPPGQLTILKVPPLGNDFHLIGIKRFVSRNLFQPEFSKLLKAHDKTIDRAGSWTGTSM